MSYLATISRATGWGREYILWELPLAHGLQIEHVEAVFNGETLDWANGRAGDTGVSGLDAMRMQFAAMKRGAKPV